MRMRAAAVGTIFEAHTLRQAQCVDVHLPAGSAVRQRGRPEDVGVAIAREIHFVLRPIRVRLYDTILPAHVIPGVDTGFEARVRDRPHDVGGTAADVGAGNNRSVHQRSHPVVTYDRRASHLAVEAGAEHALDGSARVVRAECKEKGCIDAMFAQQRHEVGNALARAAQRVDVDLERDTHRRLLDQPPRIGHLPAISVEDALQGLVHWHRRHPVEVGAGVLDHGHPVLHILIARTIVFGR